MRTRLLPAIIALSVSLLGGMTVYGHHVEVAVADTDRGTLEQYTREVDAQVAAMSEALELYAISYSVTEKRDAMLAVEVAITASIEHLRSLQPVPECMADFAALAEGFFEGIALDFETHKATGEPLTWDNANPAYGAFMLYAKSVGYSLCRPDGWEPEVTT